MEQRELEAVINQLFDDVNREAVRVDDVTVVLAVVCRALGIWPEAMNRLNADDDESFDD